MSDPLLEVFLAGQEQKGLAFAAQCDRLDLVPLKPLRRHGPVDRYLAHFNCRGLVRDRTGNVLEAESFKVGIRFPEHYLHVANPFEVFCLMEPANTFLPNVNAPFVCTGPLDPGTELVSLLYRVSDVLTGRKLTTKESDALNPLACAWAREHMPRFPVDNRPLRRAAVDWRVEDVDDTGRDS